MLANTLGRTQAAAIQAACAIAWIRAVEGEFAGNTLKLESAQGGDDKVIFNAKLKDDGTLAGYVSGPMGDLKWTAERVKGKK